jgi:hypothetical protein
MFLEEFGLVSVVLATTIAWMVGTRDEGSCPTLGDACQLDFKGVNLDEPGFKALRIATVRRPMLLLVHWEDDGWECSNA